MDVRTPESLPWAGLVIERHLGSLLTSQGEKPVEHVFFDFQGLTGQIRPQQLLHLRKSEFGTLQESTAYVQRSMPGWHERTQTRVP